MKIMKLFLIILYCFINISISLHLTYQQKNLINKILKNDKVTNNQKQIVQKILYNSYEKFAIKKAIEFKNLHRYKCNNINLNEIILYAKYGLWKSIIKFKGYVYLENYCLIYIKHELNQYLNDKYSSSIISKKERVKSKSNYTLSEINKYNFLLNTKIYSYEWNFDNINYKLRNHNNLVFDKIIYDDYLKDIWNFINKYNIIDYESKIILKLKYDYYFKKIRSNKEISNIIKYSEEYVRIKLNKSLDIIKKKIEMLF